MQFSAAQIASMLNGKVEGDASASVNALAKIEEGIPGTLTFLSNPKYESFIYTTKSSLAIVGHDFKAQESLPTTLTLIRVEDVYGSFVKLLEAYNNLSQPKPGIDPASHVAQSATMGKNVYIGPGVYVGEHCSIGDNSKLYPGVYLGDNVHIGEYSAIMSGAKIYMGCRIGSYCHIHSGVVIGADGFGFAPNAENNYQKVPQIGNVIIEDHVEIGANTTVDRATLGSTIIRKGVKLDNLIQIAHNVEIGENTVIAAQTGVAGSTRIGKNCMIGGQVGIVGHLSIADGTKIAAQSGIGNDITEPNTTVQGSPAFGIMDYKKSYVGFRKLPTILEELSRLKKELAQLLREK